jgi:hypothetical protein
MRPEERTHGGGEVDSGQDAPSNFPWVRNGGGGGMWRDGHVATPKRSTAIIFFDTHCCQKVRICETDKWIDCTHRTSKRRVLRRVNQPPSIFFLALGNEYLFLYYKDLFKSCVHTMLY